MLCRLLGLGMLATLTFSQTQKQAEQAFDAGRYAEAAQLFEKDYRETSRCQALFGLGLSQYRLQKMNAALIAFGSSIQCDPKLTLAYLTLGEAYSERHNNREALTAYLQALRLEPTNSSALRGAASIYLEEKLPQKAIEILESLVKVEPENAQAHADLGAEYLAVGNQEGAEQQFQQALRLKPNDATALLGAASISLRIGDTDKAITTLRGTAKLIPKAYEPHFLLGSAYNRQNRYAEAVDELKTAVRLGSEDSEVYYHLARAYGGLGQTEDRKRALVKFTELTKKTKATTESQRQSMKLIEEAGSFVDAGDLTAAAARLEQARELQPADDALLFRLASVHYDLREYDIARSYTEEAISLAPSKWLYHYLLGLIEIRTANWAQARASLRTAWQLNPSAPEIQTALEELALAAR